MKNILLALTDIKDILIVQAILLLNKRGIKINHVNYIRTASVEIDNITKDQFLNLDVSFKVYPLLNNGRLVNEEDYLLVEQQIFDWYVKVATQTDNVFVFIGGGHKLHSLALQKAAFLLGAEDVFHMFVNVARNEEPKNIVEIQQFIDEKKILYVSLGKENGWPTLKNIIKSNHVDYKYIKELACKVGNRNIDDINEYPFESLSLLPAKSLEWLLQPVSEEDKEFIHELPKVELHCHLGGFASNGELLDEVRDAADASYMIGPVKDIKTPKGWPLPDYVTELDQYMKLGDNSGSYILKNTGCLLKQVDLLYKHLIDQNIGYAEIRCSPYNYENSEDSGLDVLYKIQKQFDQNMSVYKQKGKFWCHVNLILIATRTDSGDTRKIEDHLRLAVVAESQSAIQGRCKIVGVDLAGYEHPGTRASYFSHLFEPVHRKGISLTIHAGENDDSEAIWDAVFKLNTRRIGHALHLYQDEFLLKSIVNRRIGIEMCPAANFQIKGFNPMPGINKVYPLLDYLRRGAQVTINTDNIGISNASITDNFILAASMNPELTRLEVLQIIRNGLEQAFIDISLKRLLIKQYNEKIFQTIFNQAQGI